ncbi:MAG: hypothetical protein MJ252_03000 [archaeon]|nr:hypothetical protein [archaeon]
MDSDNINQDKMDNTQQNISRGKRISTISANCLSQHPMINFQNNQPYGNILYKNNFYMPQYPRNPNNVPIERRRSYPINFCHPKLYDYFPYQSFFNNDSISTNCSFPENGSFYQFKKFGSGSSNGNLNMMIQQTNGISPIRNFDRISPVGHLNSSNSLNQNVICFENPMNNLQTVPNSNINTENIPMMAQNQKEDLFQKLNTDLNENKIEDFKAFIKSKKNGILETICTQRGAKETEKIIKKSTCDCISILLEEIHSSLKIVMTNTYGNYFIQKIIKMSSTEQLKFILLNIKDDFVEIAKNFSGTHVLQALVNLINNLEDQQILLSYIKDHELELAYDMNGTHVLQKIIVIVNEANRPQLNQVILNNIKDLCLDSNGICLVKKFISTNQEVNQIRLILKEKFKENYMEISQSPFGNYAMQYLFEEWDIPFCMDIIKLVIENGLYLSKQKFSSNVVEKIIEVVDTDLQNKIYSFLFSESKVLSLLKNKYGKYVLQKSVQIMKEEQKNSLYMTILNLSQRENTMPKDKKILTTFLSVYMNEINLHL